MEVDMQNTCQAFFQTFSGISVMQEFERQCNKAACFHWGLAGPGSARAQSGRQRGPCGEPRVRDPADHGARCGGGQGGEVS